ncbi:MAG: ribonuclease P protein component [Candidatus Dojkabacteria bacterium]|nr:ribonuclease P protein component [Candidatus Dojkabacteria bacterium]MDQ7021126.1 ribonuclease P protein component [Candidatus Dojkabacteria bacterium]
MLSKKYRIPKTEIPNIIKRGKRISSEFFDLKIWHDDAIKNHRFSIVISKKVSKKAVTRNKIRRKFRAAIYSLLKNNTFKKDNYIFIIKSVDLSEKKSGEIEELIEEIIIK